jgi:hypothetical protein
MHAAVARGIRQPYHVWNEWIEEPAPRRIGLLALEFAPHRAQLLAQFNAKPDRIVP